MQSAGMHFTPGSHCRQAPNHRRDLLGVDQSKREEVIKVRDQSLSGALTMPNRTTVLSFCPKLRSHAKGLLVARIYIGLCIMATPVRAFFDEAIPPQQMVMSSFRGKKAPDEPQQKMAMASEANDQTNKLISEASSLPTTQLAMMPEQTEQSVQAANSQSATALPQVDTTIEPYHILPEVGQKVKTIKPQSITQQLSQKTPEQPSSDIVSYEDVIRWVNEAGVSMFTYSGNHLVRDQKNVAQYFSPQAWQTIEQSLFQDADSPFHRLRQTRGNSRAMSLDWAKSVRIDVNKNGKLWWMKVPIVAVVSEKNSLKRVFYEVKLGVLSAPNENSKTRLIADEVVIRQVKMQEKVRKRGAGRVR